jgi:hypothetical protein
MFAKSCLTVLVGRTRLGLLLCMLALLTGAPLCTAASALAQESESAAPPPNEEPPSEIPPPPPAELPAPPEPQNAPPEAATGSAPIDEPAATPQPEGQWVFTTQYGWVFMPYAQDYTYVPASGYPLMYVFYPHYGWRWLNAPWVYGVGPHPYWGPRGYGYFAWHAHPWFSQRAGAYRAGPAGGYRGAGPGYHHAAAANYRAPAAHGGGGRSHVHSGRR